MRTSQDGIDLIKGFEGCRCAAYHDSNGVPTIGYGHTAGVAMGMRILQEQADKYLADDLQEFERYVNKYVTIPLTQHQFDALVSFTYNLGPGTLFHSFLLTNVNAGFFGKAAENFLDYDHAGGVQVVGLTRRRQAESDLFLTPDDSVARPPGMATKIKRWFKTST